MSGSQIQDLADTFVKWFYELMNNLSAKAGSSSSAASSLTSLSSSSSNASSPDFRPDHFWPDASAKICLQNGNQNSELIQVRRNYSPNQLHVI